MKLILFAKINPMEIADKPDNSLDLNPSYMFGGEEGEPQEQGREPP
jgi:hypothetical protein